MVAVAIIGILAIIAVPNFRAYKEKARIAACLTTAYSIQASLISYAAATAAGTFPDSASLSSWGDLVSICNPNGSHLTETAYESGFQDWVSYDSVETSGKTDSFTLLLRLNDVTHTTECSQLEITARSVARQTY
jgi:type II secretory pathway pseudopilin PulG